MFNQIYGPLLKEISEAVQLDMRSLHPNIQRIEFEGKDAEGRNDFKESVVKRGQAAVVYFQQGDYYAAANAADRAAKSSFQLKLLVRARSDFLPLEDNLLIKVQAPLLELCGNAYFLIPDYTNSVFAYLKSSKQYLFEHRDSKKASVIFNKADEIAKKTKILSNNAAAQRLYTDVKSRLP